MNPKEAENHTSLWPLVRIIVVALAALVVSLLTDNCCGRGP